MEKTENTVEEAVVEIVEIDETGGHVDEYGVHADDLEVEVPAAQSAHVDDAIEQGEHDERISRNGEHEGTAPQCLVDGIDEMPGSTQGGKYHTGSQQHNDLAKGGFPALHEDARKHAQQRRADGWQGGQDALGVVVGPIAMRAEQRAVDPAGDVALAGQGVYRGVNARGTDKGRHQPVAQEDYPYHRQFGPKAFAGRREDIGGKHPSQTYAPQYAGPALGGELELQQSPVNHAQEHQQEAPAQNLQVDAPLGTPVLALFLQREGEGDARNEQEEREDGVVMRQPVPRHMLHLPGYELPRGGVGEKGCNGHEQRGATRDEKHVEAPQGIQRLQSVVLLFCRHRISVLHDKDT